MEHRVHKYVDRHYPRSVTGWVCHSSWEKNKVPLTAIAWAQRPGGRDPEKVAKMVKRLKGGWRPKRVVVVDPGTEGKMVVADGFHRLAALHEAGEKKVRVLVGTPRPGAGDWRQDILDMQQEVLNAEGRQNQGKSRRTKTWAAWDAEHPTHHGNSSTAHDNAIRAGADAHQLDERGSGASRDEKITAHQRAATSHAAAAREALDQGDMAGAQAHVTMAQEFQDRAATLEDARHDSRRKSRATLEPGDEVSGARSRPIDVIQVPLSPDSYRETHNDETSEGGRDAGLVELVHFTPMETTGQLIGDKP